MARNVYKTPSSELTAGLDESDNPGTARIYMVLAYLAAPIVTSTVLVGLIIFVDGISGADFVFIGKLFLKFLLLTYALTFVFGLPLHWILGRIDRRRFLIYLGIGLVIPAPAVLLSGQANSSVAWAISAGLGASWSALFWFIAVYLYERKTNEISNG